MQNMDDMIFDRTEQREIHILELSWYFVNNIDDVRSAYG